MLRQLGNPSVQDGPIDVPVFDLTPDAHGSQLSGDLLGHGNGSMPAAGTKDMNIDAVQLSAAGRSWVPKEGQCAVHAAVDELFCPVCGHDVVAYLRVQAGGVEHALADGRVVRRVAERTGVYAKGAAARGVVMTFSVRGDHRLD